jgi:hypothetical protein
MCQRPCLPPSPVPGPQQLLHNVGGLKIGKGVRLMDLGIRLNTAAATEHKPSGGHLLVGIQGKTDRSAALSSDRQLHAGATSQLTFMAQSQLRPSIALSRCRR